MDCLILKTQYWKYFKKKEKNISNFNSWIKNAMEVVNLWRVKTPEDLTDFEGSLKICKNSINLYDYTKINMQDLYDVVWRNLGIYEHLVDRVAQKYLITQSFSKVWIGEYCKFMVIATKNQEMCFPSLRVELVWTTHMEFQEDYKKFSKFIFNRMFYPHLYHLLEDCNQDIANYYETTLLEYK